MPQARTHARTDRQTDRHTWEGEFVWASGAGAHRKVVSVRNPSPVSQRVYVTCLCVGEGGGKLHDFPGGCFCVWVGGHARAHTKAPKNKNSASPPFSPPHHTHTQTPRTKKTCSLGEEGGKGKTRDAARTDGRDRRAESLQHRAVWKNNIIHHNKIM